MKKSNKNLLQLLAEKSLITALVKGYYYAQDTRTLKVFRYTHMPALQTHGEYINVSGSCIYLCTLSELAADFNTPTYYTGVSMQDPSMSSSQPTPVSTESSKNVLPLVLADLANRAIVGIEKYNKPLQTNNGRMAIADALQESYDMSMYLRQAVEENAEIASELRFIGNALRASNVGVSKRLHELADKLCPL